MELRKNRFIFGFANGQPLLYISNVENCIQKKCHPHGQHFHDFPSYKTL